MLIKQRSINRNCCIIAGKRRIFWGNWGYLQLKKVVFGKNFSRYQGVLRGKEKFY